MLKIIDRETSIERRKADLRLLNNMIRRDVTCLKNGMRTIKCGYSLP